MFPAYVEKPADCRFEGQDIDEKIILLLRSHPITNLSWIIPATVLFFLPFILTRVLPPIGISINLLPENFFIVFLVINYLLVLVITFEGFLYWFFNVILITDHKVVDIDFEPVLYKEVNLARLTEIEEADSQTSGIFGTTFNFGNVRVQTAGAIVAIEMKSIPNPARVADLVLDLTKNKKDGAE